MILLNGIQLAFGNQIIFNDVSSAFYQGQHIGVVGRNGAGKSTLLKCIAGQMVLDAGGISIEKTKKIAYMPQEVVLESNKSVFDEAFQAFDEYQGLKLRAQELEQLCNGSNAALHIDEFVAVTERLKQFDEYDLRARTTTMLEGLGFKPENFEKLVSTLSVGWKMRLVLAKLLLSNADFYLFDEPTNHLDIVTKEWFFNFLRSSRAGYLLVSHDKYFLEHACSHIFELERGNGTMFTGGFNIYLEQKEKQRAIILATYERQVREIKEKQATIERFRASASKARMAQSMIKQVEKIELVEPDPVLPTISFSFAKTERPGRIVLEIEHVSHSFGPICLFKNISAVIQRGQKIALVGANGMGKTTLLNLILGKLPLQAGHIEIGPQVKEAVFEQDQARVMNNRNTVYQEVAEFATHATESHIRAFLGSFLFSKDEIEKKIGVLSGGERNRVAMVKVLMAHANFLILDEPTNHLDIYAKQVLLQALTQYDGTILLVTHDRDFLDSLPTHIFELTAQGLHSFEGNYTSYLEHQKHVNGAKDRAQGSAHKVAVHQPVVIKTSKLLYELEAKIAKLEMQQNKIQHSFESLAYGTKEYQDAIEKLKLLQSQLKEAYDRWEELVDGRNISS